MQTSKDYLHVFLDMGDALLNSGAEIFRVEDTLNRMGYACGATHMNVFVITSSIVITIEFPGDGARTQTRRIHECGGNDFTKLEQLNDLSRRFCSHPVSAAELRNEFEKINANRPKPLWKLLGSVLAASSFALFYGGTIPDAITAGVSAILIWSLQKYLRPVCMNEVTFQFAASFLTGCAICGFTLLCPFLHMDKIMIGDIMLLNFEYKYPKPFLFFITILTFLLQIAFKSCLFYYMASSFSLIARINSRLLRTFTSFKEVISARSLVICPPSMVERVAFSSLSANSISS